MKASYTITMLLVSILVSILIEFKKNKKIALFNHRTLFIVIFSLFYSLRMNI